MHAALCALFIYHALDGWVRSPWLRALAGAALILLPLAPIEIADSAVGAPWYVLTALFFALLWRPKNWAGMTAAALVAFAAASSEILAVIYAPLVLLRLVALPRWREHAVTAGWLAACWCRCRQDHDLDVGAQHDHHPVLPAAQIALSTGSGLRRYAASGRHGHDVLHRIDGHVGEIRLRPGSAAGHRGRVLIRRETERDTDIIRAITTAAFASSRPPGQIVPEARLIDELRAGPAWLPALSLVAADPAGEVIGHVLGTRGHVGPHPVLALGPLAVRPDRQRRGVGSALMHAVLGAADALGEPLAALLGDPAYYRRFGFELSNLYQITPPRPHWQSYFQVRVLSGYDPRLGGMFTYPEPFDRT